MAGTLCSVQVLTHTTNPRTLEYAVVLYSPLLPSCSSFPFFNMSGGLGQELALNYPGNLPGEGLGRERPEERSVQRLLWSRKMYLLYPWEEACRLSLKEGAVL